MKNKRSIIIIIVLLLMVIVSGTMAWLSYQSKKTALVLVLGDDDSFVITIDPYHYKGTLPSSVNYSQLSTYSSVSANNSSVFEENFIFYYRVNEIDEELLGGSLKFAIRRSTSLNGTYTEVASGTFNSSNTAKDYFVFEDTVPASTTYYYKGYIYIDGSSNNSALVDKTVNLEFRATFGFTGAQMLINKANGSNITTYTAGDTGEMYTFSQPDTVQLAATTDYRYIGDSPNNYIEFNDEVWRIIGVFDGKIKIIKDDFFNINWDYKKKDVGSSESDYGSNDWIDAQLMYMLNPSDIESNVTLKSGYTYDGSLVRDSKGQIIYQNGCRPASVSTTTTSYNCTASPWSLNSTALNQVTDTIYYLGSSSQYNNLSASDYYTIERGNTIYNSRSLNWSGKVGLMYPSDYVYTYAYGVDDICYNNGYNCDTGSPSSSWLFNTSSEWTLTSKATYDTIYCVSEVSKVYNGHLPISNRIFRPVVYLKSNIKLTGNGTNDENIYKIVDASKSIKKKELYNVIRIEAASGSGNAAKYTGLDSDTYANDVYYFKGSATNTNVLFANHCWQMIRTTDTGGVKLLYNGTATNGTCNNTGTASQLSNTSAFNGGIDSPAYVGYMYNTVYASATSTTSTISSDYVYGNSFTYANGTYTLSGSTTTGAWSSIHNTLSNTHYTCLNNTGTCTDIKYIYYTTSSTMYYITLTGGKSVNVALNEMLWSDDVNKTNSTIKTTIDTWYASNMTSYTSYLEDTVYCNDRSVYNLNGWNPNGGTTTNYLRFYSNNKKDLTCTNKNDRFTMSSTLGNGKLTYPVGLMTAGEASLIGSTLITTGQTYWLGSPIYFSNGSAREFRVSISGSLGSVNVGYADGVRPVVSLKPGTQYVDGEGSGDDPFLVE